MCIRDSNETIHEFHEKVDKLEDTIREMGGPCVVAGDFNAKAVEWGMPATCARGRYVLEMAARVGLAVVNVGGVSTFRRPGYAETIPDITLVSDTLAHSVMNWEVLEDYTGSDHQYITFTLRSVQHSPIAEPSRTHGWNVSKLDVELLQDVIAIGKEAVMNSLGPT